MGEPSVARTIRSHVGLSTFGWKQTDRVLGSSCSSATYLCPLFQCWWRWATSSERLLWASGVSLYLAPSMSTHKKGGRGHAPLISGAVQKYNQKSYFHPGCFVFGCFVFVPSCSASPSLWNFLLAYLCRIGYQDLVFLGLSAIRTSSCGSPLRCCHDKLANRFVTSILCVTAL